MKKKVSLLVLLFLLFMPLIAKADMGAPMVRTYEAVVIKVDGADYYEQDNDWNWEKKGHLNKDDKVKIEFESTDDGEVYLAFNKGGGYYFVKASDVAPLEKEVKPNGEGIIELDKEQKIRVEAKEGVEVKKGPSVAYETVGTLKKGTEATYKYEIDESGYIYVDTGDIKGWVLTLEGTVLFSGGDYVLADDIELTCGKVPANTVLKDTWYTDMWTGDILIEYKNCKDYFNWFKDSRFVVYGRNITGNVTKEAVMYEKPNMKKKVGTIPKDGKMKIYSENYIEDEYDPDAKALIYVEYDGQKGWIVTDNIIYNDEKFEDEEEKKQEVEEPKEEKKESKEDDEEEESKIDTKTIVIVCVVGAGAFALGAIATIILVNRKNKKARKQEETTIEAADEKKE